MAAREGSVSRVVEALLGETPTAPPVRQPMGYGNENWVVDVGSRRILVKIARPEHPTAKADSASRAQQLAHASGVPVARELALDTRCEAAGGRIVRILEYLPGEHPARVLDSPTRVATFFDSLGRAVAQLHSVRCDAFASRVGGSPAFTSWGEYVAYRAPQIADRGRACTRLTGPVLGAVLDEAVALAQQISTVVQPRLTHRGLYLDNLLAGPDGEVCALLDLDLAEPWDPVADLVKLRWQVFPLYPGAEQTFWSAYTDANGPLPRFAERLRLAQLLELSNHVINAEAAGKLDHATDARRRLDLVLGERSWARPC